MLGPARVRPGDVLIGLRSPGLRCNGYTLARHVLLERAGRTLDGPAWPGADVTLADELLRPSVIYTPAVRAAIAATGRSRGPASMPSPTSPAEGSAATCRGCCPRGCGR